MSDDIKDTDQAKKKNEVSTRDVIPGLGQAVRARRDQLGFTLTWLAEQVETHFANLSKIEKGERAVTLRTAAKLATAFGCTVDDLMKDAERFAANKPTAS